MKALYDNISFDCSKKLTKAFSTSFSFSSRLLPPAQRQAIYAIYGFVRVADEIVDTYHDFPQETLLNRFERDLNEALETHISTNPILNAFQETVFKYDIEREMIDAFLKSMRLDLEKKEYKTREEYQEYIYGSADVVGLMCLKVFVEGENNQYEKLKDSAMKLGSAFQKVNFLRDLKNDMELLERSYFPHIDFKHLTMEVKREIVEEIVADFDEAFTGIRQLPDSSRLAVYVAYVYYKKLLRIIRRKRPEHILQTRIRVSNAIKMWLLFKSYLRYKAGLLKRYD
ncbi:MAG: phytoene synthase [Bacteroides sp. SM23_62]|nr:MAG: phytoene synthase [Bacteroides sp. SM23_62]